MMLGCTFKRAYLLLITNDAVPCRMSEGAMRRTGGELTACTPRTGRGQAASTGAGVGEHIGHEAEIWSICSGHARDMLRICGGYEEDTQLVRSGYEAVTHRKR